MSHPIDYGTLRKAAEQLLNIDAAGYLGQVRQEYHLRLRESGVVNRWTDPMQAAGIDHLAKLLAEVTDSPIGQAQAALRDAAGMMPRRNIGLDLLAQMDSDVRRLQAQVTRQRMQPRRAS
jgi:hypothetical protein